MKENRERGAVVVEATLSLTAFMFAILIILSIADIAYTQSKMAVALNSAAKEISQYCFLYYKFQLDKPNADMSNGTEEAQKTVEDTMDGMGQMMDSFGNAGTAFEEKSFDSAVDELEKGANAANETVSNLASQFAEDPKAFVAGMGKLAGRELAEAGKVYLGQIMAKAFMAKNLKSFSGDNPDAFLRRLHVVDGMDGLDFQYTSMMAYGVSNEIQLVCTYQVRVVRLLNMDFTFTFRQTARTLAWGNGVSQIIPRSIWALGNSPRGHYIVDKEKENYTYTDSGQGFDAYVNSGGKNEFVTITSINSTASSYKTVRKIKERIGLSFDALYKGVSSLDSPVTMTKGNKEVTVDSDPATRTYQVVVVFPEGTSDEYMDLVDQAIAELKKEHSDIVLDVVTKQGYGLPKSKTADSEKPENGSDADKEP